MKKITLFFALILTGVSTFASKAKLSNKCEQAMVDVIMDKFARYNDTFSTTGYKVIYSGLYNYGLAVVQTSDENEPRDMLVSYNDNHTSCSVEYKETLADGMVADFGNSLIQLELAPRRIANNYSQISGKIEKMIVGEFDPFKVGEACSIVVRTANETVSLLTGFYECEENEKNLKVGSEISAQLHKDDLIQDESILNILISTSKGDRYFNIPYSEISAK